MEKKLNLKEKAKNLWNKHKGTIITITTLLGIVIYVAATNKDQDENESQEPTITPVNEPDREQTFEEKEADPERKLACGGWVLENELDNQDLPMLIANDVPISALGEFGQELVKKAEGLDLGRFNQDLSEAWTSIMINFETPDAQDEKEEPADEQPAA